jgi:hypothetical protein
MLQSNQVLSFFRACERGDWSQPELAEFYRVEGALTKSGVGISTDRGLTDEGEPWFVFFRQDNEEVIVHFARIGGEYVVASNFTEAVFRGRNFPTLVRELLDSHPYVLPKQHSPRSTVFLHPAALLAALVVTGYVKSSELNASADDGSRPEKSLGWFLNRHDLAATYSAIVIAAVWDSLAIDSSVSKPSDDLVSLDHAQPAHGEHGIGQAVAEDSLLQNFQAFHGTDDRSVLTAAALDLDGQDAVHNVNEPAIAGLVANPSGLHPESPHHDNAAAFSAHLHVEDTVNPLILNVTSLSDAVWDLKPEVMSTSEPTAQANQVASASELTAHANQVTSTSVPTAHVNQVTSTSVPTAQVSQLTSTSELTAHANQLTSTSELTAQANQLTSTSELTAQASQVTSTSVPTAQVNQVTSTSVPTAALPGGVTANPLELSGTMQAQHDAEACMSDGSTLSIVGIDVHHTATALA